MRAIVFPGQGSQFKGMGADLFPAYPELTQCASDILGYAIESLCLEDPDNRLRSTEYTQPALYVVNALGYYRKRDTATSAYQVDFFAGHSLGEYNALLAADVFDFATGLKLVKQRGELMAAADGTMAAVVGVSATTLERLLRENHFDGIDLANFNSPTQLVLAGTAAEIAQAAQMLTQNNIRCVTLNVGVPFHSRYMRATQTAFAEYIQRFRFNRPSTPVIANATARPYAAGRIAETLAAQIASSVRWTDSVRYLLAQGVSEFEEIGGVVLTKLVNEIKTADAYAAKPDQQHQPSLNGLELAPLEAAEAGAEPLSANALDDGERVGAAAIGPTQDGISAESLGSAVFRRRYGLRYAYVAGGMYRGIASPQLVVALAKAGFMGCLGTGGLALQAITEGIRAIQRELGQGQPYAMNLLANYSDPTIERETVELYLKYGIAIIEASAFVQMTPALVLFRLSGLEQADTGGVICRHRILAKVSRLDVATTFMSPPPALIVRQLLAEGAISAKQAELAQRVPMSHDICVEAEAGSDPTVLLPTMLRLKQLHDSAYQEPICMGLAGGIGTPEALAAAFVIGADFVVTGSINQCTVEADISEDVKLLLQDADIHDTDYAPARDIDMTANIQVLKKGIAFATRAKKLQMLYCHYASLDEIPEKLRRLLENTYFKKSFGAIWHETKIYYEGCGQHHEIRRAEANPKYKMALVFGWYFTYAADLAFAGNPEDRVNYQVRTSPAIGAFNRWVKGTALDAWDQRHVDTIALQLMIAAAEHLNQVFAHKIIL